MIQPAKSILIGFPYQILSITIAIIFRIHFSYNDISQSDTDKMANNLGKRWEERNRVFSRSYMSECRLCDEYLYLPIPANGTTYEHRIFYDETKAQYVLGHSSSIGEFVFCLQYLCPLYKLNETNVFA